MLATHHTLWLLSFLNSTLTDIILVMLRSHYSQLCLSVKLHASVSLLFLVVLLLVLLVLLFPMLCPLFPMLTLSSCCSLCYSCSFSSHHLSGLVSASLGHLRSTYTSSGIPLSVSTVFPFSPGRSLTASDPINTGERFQHAVAQVGLWSSPYLARLGLISASQPTKVFEFDSSLQRRPITTIEVPTTWLLFGLEAARDHAKSFQGKQICFRRSYELYEPSEQTSLCVGVGTRYKLPRSNRLSSFWSVIKSFFML